MIIAHIIGGLGNQLFQYAAARYLSHKHNVPLKLDVTDIKQYHIRSFELSNLHTNFTIASDQEIQALKPSSSALKVWQSLLPKSKRTYHRERRFEVERSFFNIGPSAYLKGNFQSYQYFESIDGVIRKEFVIDEKLVGHLTDYAQQLRDVPSVSVHIRRGDYLNKETLAYHGVLSKQYYEAALQRLTDEKGPLQVYFFSDDIEWVKENLPVEGATYVSGVITHNHYEDLYLMSYCRHNIIANSSFSWWAAWLNSYAGKRVIGPAKWFNAHLDTSDLTPPDWHRL